MRAVAPLRAGLSLPVIRERGRARVPLGTGENTTLERAVGNYGEVFERNIGQGSPLRLPRGPNVQWTGGGLMYAIPFRGRGSDPVLALRGQGEEEGILPPPGTPSIIFFCLFSKSCW